MPERHADWLAQARLDLDHARLAEGAGHFEWAALHLSLGGDAWGHDLTRLIELLPPSHRAPADLVDRGKALDKHYLPARYPNGFAAGTRSIPR